MGFVPLGPCRSCPAVQDHPAEGYMLDAERMRASAPRMYEQVFGEPVPDEVLAPRPLPAGLAREFGSRSSQADGRAIARIVECVGSLRRWS